MKCEICCDSAENALIAKQAGADRVELCSALSCGGVTPTLAMIKKARQLCGPEFPIHVLIRCREGDFTYSQEELSVMQEDIKAAIAAGATGVVIGALTKDGEIDIEALKALCEAAKGISITYSRAFDLAKDLPKALCQLIELGCDRVLTSGGAPTAMEGIECLKELNQLANGKITLLAGSGINENNFKEILQTGIQEIHGSMRCLAPENGYKQLPGLDNHHQITSSQKVKTVSNYLNHKQ